MRRLERGRGYHLHATVFHVTGSTADTFVEYAQRMCLEGVTMHVTEVRKGAGL